MVEASAIHSMLESGTEPRGVNGCDCTRDHAVLLRTVIFQVVSLLLKKNKQKTLLSSG